MEKLSKAQKKKVDQIATVETQGDRGHRGRFLKRKCADHGYPSLADGKSVQRTGTGSKQKVYQVLWAKREEAGQMIEAYKTLTSLEREQILNRAAEVKAKGQNPLDAMTLGAGKLNTETEYDDIPIGTFWKDYVADKTRGKNIEDKVWKSPKHLKENRWFYEKEKDGIFSQPLSVFRDKIKGRKQLELMFKRYATEWKAKKTCKLKLSYIREFLKWIEEGTKEGGFTLSGETIGAICSSKAVIPKGKKASRENRAATIAQACSLIDGMSHCKYRTCNRGRPPRPRAGYIVMKLFMGARSELIPLWKWSVWNKEAGRIVIPANQTKGKEVDVEFNVSQIPPLEKFLPWAWEIDGCPSDNEFITGHHCHTDGNRKTWINMNKNIFSVSEKQRLYDLSSEIKPRETHHNLERSAFITYGKIMAGLAESESMEITRATIARVAEDETCWGDYVDKSVDVESAKKFFELTPDNYQQVLKEEVGKIEEYNALQLKAG